MSLDLQNESHKALLEAMLWRRVPNCKKIHNIQQLTGGASRQMFKVNVETTEKEMHLVLRRLSGGEDVENDNEMVEQLSLPQEVVVMQAVLKSGVATPEVYFEFEDTDGIGAGYAMEFIEGETLGGRIAKSKKFIEARKKLTVQVAVSLAGIHQVDVVATGLDKRLPSFTPLSSIEKTYKVYRSSNIDVPMLEYAVHWLKNNIPAPVAPTLTHGDFRNGNFLVDPEKGMVSILDWELGALGDPMRDLAWMCLNPWRYGVSQLPVGGFGNLEDFFQVYEAEIGKPVDQQSFKFWQVYGCFWWSIACIMMGLTYRMFEGKLADRIAIGRRHTEGLIDIANLLMPGPLQLNPPAPESNEKEVATLSELVQSTQKDIMTEITPTVKGKPLFLSRVAISNLGIALREVEQGAYRDEEEIKGTNALLKTNFKKVVDCRAALCEQIRAGKWELDNADLQNHLRNCVARQIAIDQPKYSGLGDALKVNKIKHQK